MITNKRKLDLIMDQFGVENTILYLKIHLYIANLSGDQDTDYDVYFYKNKLQELENRIPHREY